MNHKKQKFLRFIGATKPIELDEYEVNWIKLCKGKYNKKYNVGDKNWIETLKPMFEEIYGYNPDENYDSFIDCMFHKLTDIYLKIQFDQSGQNIDIKNIIISGAKSIFPFDNKEPMERIISMLCSKIQGNQVIDNYGLKRYHL